MTLCNEMLIVVRVVMIHAVVYMNRRMMIVIMIIHVKWLYCHIMIAKVMPNLMMGMLIKIIRTYVRIVLPKYFLVHW